MATKPPDKKDTVLALRIDRKIKDAAKVEARNVRRSLSGWVEVLIVEALERAKRGIRK